MDKLKFTPKRQCYFVFIMFIKRIKVTAPSFKPGIEKKWAVTFALDFKHIFIILFYSFFFLILFMTDLLKFERWLLWVHNCQKWKSTVDSLNVPTMKFVGYRSS